MGLTCIAVDCGAESGRVMAVSLDPAEGRSQCHEIHRFPTPSQQRGANWYWDWDGQLAEIHSGLAKALSAHPDARAMSVDTWGVDVVACDVAHRPLAAPRCYRDPRGQRGQARLDGLYPAAARFARSGCAQLPINTLDQLAAMAIEEPELLDSCEKLLFLPDHVLGALSGVWGCERSIAATSSCTQAGAWQWDEELLRAIGVNAQLFPPISPSGRVLGPLLSHPACTVIASAGHDTAAAVAALPADAESVAYLSCGTWSLMGTVLDQPLLDPAAAAAGLSNEAHWDGRMRLNRNIMGLWILQQCRQDWLRADPQHAAADYAALSQAARSAADPALPLQVDDPRFLPPSTADSPMLTRVQQWFAEQGQPPPTDPPSIARAILHGLAHCYAQALAQLRRLSGRRLESVVFLGGGGRNALLRELTAVACGCPVTCGAPEATALGNALIQAHSLGVIDATRMRDLAEAAAEL